MTRTSLALTGILLFLAGNLPAQTTTSSGVGQPGQAATGSSQSTMNALELGRDQHAVALVENAIAALGGDTAIGQAQSWRVKAEVQRAVNSSGTSGGAATSTVEWEAAGAEVRATGTSGSRSWMTVTGHGNPMAIASGISKSLNPRSTHSMIVPALVGPMLLAELQNGNVSITYGGRRLLHGGTVEIVKTQSPGFGSAASRQSWFIDEKSGFPVRLEYERVHESGQPAMGTGAFEFSQYSAIGAALYPLQISVYRGGLPIANVTVQSVETNVPVQAADFDPPSGGAQ